MRRLVSLRCAVLAFFLLGIWVVPAPLSNAASQTPIQHIVIIVRENHTFDNYFGTFPGANGLQNAPYLVIPHHIEGPIKDLCHSWGCAHLAYDNGRMDGFFQAAGSGQTFGYYDQRDIPYYWSLAKQYTLFDNYFSSIMGPSLPNYVYLVAGQSGGLIDNTHLLFNFRPIMDELDSSGISWRYYAGYGTMYTGWNPLPGFPDYYAKDWAKHVQVSDAFLAELGHGILAQVTWIMPTSDENSEHPPYSIQSGEAWVKSVITGIQSSKFWPSTAILLTWDDYGGWYDHIVPPQVDKYGYGFRVPLILVSPYAKQGYIDHTAADHTSLLKFIETNFHLESLTDRDVHAYGLRGAFTFPDLHSPRKPHTLEAASTLELTVPVLKLGTAFVSFRSAVPT